MNKKLIIDFDSTFVKSEGLEELAALVLAERSDRDELLEKITAVTNKGMNGELDFTESLEARLKHIPASKDQVLALAESIKEQVSASFVRNRKFFAANAEDIYIFSGGFKDFILPVLIDYGLHAEHVFANTFIYDESGRVCGFDRANFLAMPKGKVKLLESLRLAGEIIVVGDGNTDFEMREAGLAHTFIAFTENVCRDQVMIKADYVAKSFEDVLAVLALQK